MAALVGPNEIARIDAREDLKKDGAREPGHEQGKKSQTLPRRRAA